MRLLSVNLTDQTEKDLARAAALADDSLTDTVNRAIQVYALLIEAARQSEGECVGLRDLGPCDLLCFSAKPIPIVPATIPL